MGLLREHRFGVRLLRAQDAKLHLPAPPGDATSAIRKGGGKITLGGVDESQFKGPITYAPVQPHKGFWQVGIDGVYVNEKLVKKTKNYAAVLDTGTPTLILPPNQALDFFEHLGGTPEGGKSPFYTVPCNTRIDVKVKIGGAFIPIKAQDLNDGYSDSSQEDCLVKLLGINATNANKKGTYPSKAPDVIILGLPLLLNTYTIFDYTNGSRIGFAQLVDNGNLPTIAPIDVAETETNSASDVRAVAADEDFAPHRHGMRRRSTSTRPQS